MPGRDTPRSRDPDDWFAGLGPAAPRRERLVEVPAAPPARISALEADEGDDWLGDDTRTHMRGESTFADFLSDRWVAIVAGVLLVACVLVGGLVLAGVFSGSKHKRVAATTRIASTQTTTTASSTTQLPATTVSPPPTTLKPGDQGTQVRVLQQVLASLGYSVGTVDGNYGAATKSAVARFQSAVKLTGDGIFGPATLAALVSALSGP
jgi:Putative peptidoglycan binding domain